MKAIVDYIKSLSVVGERKDILSSLTQLEEELGQYTISAVEDFLEIFPEDNLKSNYSKLVSKAISKHSQYSGSYVRVVLNTLKNIQSNIPYLEKEVKQQFSFQFNREGMTYKRANLLRYIETAHFFTRYSRKMVLRLLADEGASVGTVTPHGWSKAELKWLDEKAANFGGLLPAMSQDTNTLKATIAKISDAIVDEGTSDAAVTSFGHKGLDPMRLAGFSPTSNYFFSFGKALAEWKVKRYQNSKEEFQACQLRLQELREIQNEGKASPKLQQLIRHTEQRIEHLDYKISKIEEEHSYL